MHADEANSSGDAQDRKADFESIIRGQLPGAELVLGLVGPVGVDLPSVVKDLFECLRKYRYEAQEIHVSDLIGNLVEIPAHDRHSEYARAAALMTAGNRARQTAGNNAILALAAASQIYASRPETQEARVCSRQASIISSLKHPDEVNALRRIYGSAFFLLGVYSTPDAREEWLTKKKDRTMSADEAVDLMRRDESEGFEYGQRARDTYHLSDFFLRLEENDENGARSQARLERFLDIVFSNPFCTPLFDEYAMFMAFAGATRSADLSRQIGAVIAKDDVILASGVNECPRAGGGTYWPSLDTNGKACDFEHGRDYRHGYDRNDKEKERIIDDAVEAMKKAWEESGRQALDREAWGALRAALQSSTIDDITEYGRPVHAEMDALLACARNGISCQGATLYSTTFPCHNCAKHIIAAGIDRVVYIEPYPKSKALEFHGDAATPGFAASRPDEDRRVVFEPFTGVGPRRFFDLFSTKQGSGFPLKRKDKQTGKILQWRPEAGTMRLPEFPWSYLDREAIATQIVAPCLRGADDEGPEGNPSAPD